MRLRLISTIAAGVIAISASHSARANCPQINEFKGLIFDAGAYPASQNMESHLDQALMLGVEKVGLFPHPEARNGNQPEELEEVFPDLVLRGVAPWSNAPAVMWPEPVISDGGLGMLEEELERDPDRPFLLAHPSRFDIKTLIRLATTYPNLWIGLSAPDLKALTSSCVKGDLAALIQAAGQRTVFASYGTDTGWKSYKWTIRSLRKFATMVSAKTADDILYRNAENLYRVAVNAP